MDKTKLVQGDLWDEAERLKTKAIDDVEDNNSEWTERALVILRQWLPTRRIGVFTSTDVWMHLSKILKPPKEPRAMGALMRAAHKSGLCYPTEQWTPTGTPSSHNRPMRIWRSILR